MKFKVSVIIPTFNRINLLQRTLNSLLKQTRPPDEIIVIDDGSGDGSAAMIGEKFPEVRYVWQENQGVSRARNRGIELGRYEWLAFLDSDDEWLPAKLEKQNQALTRNPEYRICHANEIWIRRGRRVNPMKKHAKYGGYIFQKCLPLCVISPSSVIIHREIFDSVGRFDESLPACEDYDLWLRICATYPVLYLDEPLIVKYGGYKDQLSLKYWGMDRFRIKGLEKIIQSEKLSPADLKAALETLLQKINIYIQGAEKRGKSTEVKRYLEKKEFYLAKYQNLR
jgi:glycosyltransferase involved in cell wall biosynthesis